MNLYKSLLFLHGHVADVGLARTLAEAGSPTDPPAPSAGASQRRPAARLARPRPSPGFFRSLWYLGGLDDVDPRIGDDGRPYGPTYGNRVASARAFGERVAPRLPPGCVMGGCA